MSPIPLEIVLSRMAPGELCEALALLRWCSRLGTVDADTADQLSRRILARPSFRPGDEPVEAALGSRPSP